MISYEKLKELLSYDYHKLIKIHPTGAPQKISFSPGVYSVECWGAKGGSNTLVQTKVYGGNGAYTFGMVRFEAYRTIYAYVGLHSDTINVGLFGGGGGGDISGGGGTDLRLIEGDTLESLKSRIIVAGGGGGADENKENGGYGGGYNGGNSSFDNSFGASQISGGTGFYHGTFGKGGGISNRTGDSTAGGGGGYYGGGSGKTKIGFAGSGGSSFISGLDGCDAVLNDDSDPPTHSGLSSHYSGITFFNPIMIDGNSEMPSYNDDTFSTTFTNGNEGDGFIRIRLIHKLHYFSKIESFNYILPSLLLFIFILNK